MRCPSCQAENDGSVGLCFECGAPLGAIVKGSVIASRYEILKTLGKGGMGMVYLAHDRELDEAVALKVLRSDLAHSAELTKRFRSEIKLARRVAHRNVCRIFEYGQDGPRQYIAMAYVDGVDLKRLVQEQGPFPRQEAFEIAIRVAEALEAIHEEGIVHRDLKTSNIMKDGKGVVRLMDFGIAKDQAAGSEADLTGTGQVIGSPEYMSPEQCLGRRADARSDIYALGVVVYELFTGRLPFHADNPLVVMRLHVQEPPPLDGPPAALLPDPLRPVLERALAKEPSERFASAADMAEALRRARTASCPAGATPVSARTLPSLGSTAAAPRPQQRDVPATEAMKTPVPMAAPTVVPTARAQGQDRVTASARTAASRRPFLLGAAALATTAAVLAGLWAGLSTRVPARGPAGSGGSPAAAPPATAASRAVRTPEPAPTPTVLSVTSPPKPTRTPQPAPAVTQRLRPALTMAPRLSALPPTTLPVMGTLRVTVVPPADITIDGRPVTGSLRKIPLAAGTYAVRLEHADYQPIRRAVRIRPGEVTALEIDFAEDGVRRR